MPRRLLSLCAAGLLFAAPLVAGCSSDTAEKTKGAAESAGDDIAEGADTAQARTTAEALRASLKGNATADEEGIRSVTAIVEAAEDLPGDPEVTGVDDGDGDGLDDDGKVQVTVDEQQVCVVLPETGEDTTVEDGAC